MAKRNPIPICLLGCTLLAVLIFGLDPKEYDFLNHVSRIADGPGIRFEKFGIAHTQLDARLIEQFESKDGFSLALVFQSKQLDNNGSGHILTLHPGNDRDQLVVWQWFSHIIVMNDNDYAHRRKTGRVSASMDSYPGQDIYLLLTTGTGGTTLYFNGQAVSSTQSLSLNFPAARQTNLVLGNSIYGDGPWHGTISGLALFDRELQPESVASLYSAWKDKGAFAEAAKEAPSALYLFNEEEGAPVRDWINGTASLLIPSSSAPLSRKFLTKSPGESGFTGSLAMDVLINLGGFVPLGLFFAAVISNGGNKSNRRRAACATIFCLAVSLAVEIFQAWIPSRSSQFLDLLLNTTGGCLGALLFSKTTGAGTLKFLLWDN